MCRYAHTSTTYSGGGSDGLVIFLLYAVIISAGLLKNKA